MTYDYWKTTEPNFNETAEDRGCEIWEDPREAYLHPTGEENVQELEGDES